MKLASRSAIASLNSANCPSSALMGSNWALVLACCELRSEAREEGRNGVVGRDGIRVREVERWRTGH